MTEMTDSEKLEAIRSILMDWASLRGHDLCHDHPTVLGKVCELVGISDDKLLELPPRCEFESRCGQYTDKIFNEGVRW